MGILLILIIMCIIAYCYVEKVTSLKDDNFENEDFNEYNKKNESNKYDNEYLKNLDEDIIENGFNNMNISNIRSRFATTSYKEDSLFRFMGQLDEFKMDVIFDILDISQYNVIYDNTYLKTLGEYKEKDITHYTFCEREMLGYIIESDYYERLGGTVKNHTNLISCLVSFRNQTNNYNHNLLEQIVRTENELGFIITLLEIYGYEISISETIYEELKKENTVEDSIMEYLWRYDANKTRVYLSYYYYILKEKLNSIMNNYNNYEKISERYCELNRLMITNSEEASEDTMRNVYDLYNSYVIRDGITKRELNIYTHEELAELLKDVESDIEKIKRYKKN